jgi:lincosamide nucleotidyltransferase A/C/D/E
VTSAEAVLDVLDLLRAHQVRVWIGGGWGIDALVGRQTRPHADLDIVVLEAETTLAALEAAGFEVVVDWSPGRVAVRRTDGAEVDVHPIVFLPDGSAVQTTHEGVEYVYPANGFATGRIGGREVPCITAALQVAFHGGYEPQEKDVADMATLRRAGLV